MSPASFFRGVVAAFVLLASATLATSCVKALSLDAYSGALGDLCAQLAECYGPEFYADCVARTEPMLEGASPEQRETFLAAFGERGCLNDCVTARECLDAVPICAGLTGGCGMLEHCCGFTQGSAQCDAGRCCRPIGSACTDASECCPDELGGELRCQAPDEGGPATCGGAVCRLEGEECGVGLGPCCGDALRCDPFESRCLLCGPFMAPCDADTDCCDGFCGFELGKSGTCQPPSCLGNGSDCNLPEDCCGGYCVDVGGFFVCSDCPGAPDGFPCAVHTQGEDPAPDVLCCHGCDPASGFCGASTCLGLGAPCDPMSAFCCPGSFCGFGNEGDPSVCCGDFGTFCTTDEDCCGAPCVMNGCGSVCDAEVQQPCSSDAECLCGNCDPSYGCCPPIAQCWDPCFVGPPIAEWCFMPGDATFSCVATICNDPATSSCCCTAWSQDCVDAFEQECNLQCPSNGGMTP
jgi:hypothetical protein